MALPDFGGSGIDGKPGDSFGGPEPEPYVPRTRREARAVEQYQEGVVKDAVQAYNDGTELAFEEAGIQSEKDEGGFRRPTYVPNNEFGRSVKFGTSEFQDPITEEKRQIDETGKVKPRKRQSVTYRAGDANNPNFPNPSRIYRVYTREQDAGVADPNQPFAATKAEDIGSAFDLQGVSDQGISSLAKETVRKNRQSELGSAKSVLDARGKQLDVESETLKQEIDALSQTPIPDWQPEGDKMDPALAAELGGKADAKSRQEAAARIGQSRDQKIAELNLRLSEKNQARIRNSALQIELQSQMSLDEGESIYDNRVQQLLKSGAKQEDIEKDPLLGAIREGLTNIQKPVLPLSEVFKDSTLTPQAIYETRASQREKARIEAEGKLAKEKAKEFLKPFIEQAADASISYSTLAGRRNRLASVYNKLLDDADASDAKQKGSGLRLRAQAQGYADAIGVLDDQLGKIGRQASVAQESAKIQGQFATENEKRVQQELQARLAKLEQETAIKVEKAKQRRSLEDGKPFTGPLFVDPGEGQPPAQTQPGQPPAPTQTPKQPEQSPLSWFKGGLDKLFSKDTGRQLARGAFELNQKFASGIYLAAGNDIKRRGLADVVGSNVNVPPAVSAALQLSDRLFAGELTKKTVEFFENAAAAAKANEEAIRNEEFMGLAPVSKEYQESDVGQVVKALSELPVYIGATVANPAMGLAVTFGPAYDEAIQNQIRAGVKDPDHVVALAEAIPVAGIEQAGNIVQLGLGKVVGKAFLEKLKTMSASSVRGLFAKAAGSIAGGSTSEGLEEGLQTFWSNAIAKHIGELINGKKIDPDRPLSQDVLKSVYIAMWAGGAGTAAIGGGSVIVAGAQNAMTAEGLKKQADDMRSATDDIPSQGWSKWADSLTEQILDPATAESFGPVIGDLDEQQTQFLKGIADSIKGVPLRRLLDLGESIDQDIAKGAPPPRLRPKITEGIRQAITGEQNERLVSLARIYGERANLAAMIQNETRLRLEVGREIGSLATDPVDGGLDRQSAGLIAAKAMFGSDTLTQEELKAKYRGMPIIQTDSNGLQIPSEFVKQDILSQASTLSELLKVTLERSSQGMQSVEAEEPPEQVTPPQPEQQPTGKPRVVDQARLKTPQQIAQASAKTGSPALMARLEGTTPDERWASVESKMKNLVTAIGSKGLDVRFVSDGSASSVAFEPDNRTLRISLNRESFMEMEGTDPEANNRYVREEIAHLGDLAEGALDAKRQGIDNYRQHWSQQRSNMLSRIFSVAKQDKSVEQSVVAAANLYLPRVEKVLKNSEIRSGANRAAVDDALIRGEVKPQFRTVADVQQYMIRNGMSGEKGVRAMPLFMSEMLRMLKTYGQPQTEARNFLRTAAKVSGGSRAIIKVISDYLRKVYKALFSIKDSLVKADPQLAEDLSNLLSEIDDVLSDTPSQPRPEMAQRGTNVPQAPEAQPRAPPEEGGGNVPQATETPEIVPPQGTTEPPVIGQAAQEGPAVGVVAPPEQPRVRIVPKRTDAELKAIPSGQVVDFPVNKIVVNDKIQQFKKKAKKDSGVVKPLTGEYQATPKNPIVVWQRNDGVFEVITGRHRLDLAKRNNLTTIPAQIVKESEGWTQEIAETFDAEANIRDGQGDIEDFAYYFRKSGISEEEATAKGLLRDDGKGRSGFLIANEATEDVYMGLMLGKVDPGMAVIIASGAPKSVGQVNESIQRAALNYISSERVTQQDVRNFISGMIATFANKSPSESQGDLFGNDDSALELMKQRSKKASKIQKDIKQNLNAMLNFKKLSGESQAKALQNVGISIAAGEDAMAKVNQKITDLQAELDSWERWATDTAKVNQLDQMPDIKAQTIDTQELMAQRVDDNQEGGIDSNREEGTQSGTSEGIQRTGSGGGIPPAGEVATGQPGQLQNVEDGRGRPVPGSVDQRLDGGSGENQGVADNAVPAGMRSGGGAQPNLGAIRTLQRRGAGVEAGRTSNVNDAERTLGEGLETQVPWVPVIQGNGVSLKTFAPVGIADEIRRNLERIDRERGGLENYVSQALGFSDPSELYKVVNPKAGSRFNKEQVETIAAALDRMDSGKANIIGHEMGIGKGRICAALLYASHLRGQTPIFFTANSRTLYPTLMDDFRDLGFKMDPFITDQDFESVMGDGNVLTNKGKNPKAQFDSIISSKKLPAGKTMVMTTWEQARLKDVNPVLNALAPNAVFIIDEAHKGTGDSLSSNVARGILKKAKGVAFSSGTAIKNLEAMRLYFPFTSVNRAIPSVRRLNQLLKKFANPLLELMNRGLVSAGEYIRYQRGLTHDGKPVPFTPLPLRTGPQIAEVNNTANEIAGELKQVQAGPFMKQLRGALLVLAKAKANEIVKDKPELAETLTVKVDPYPMKSQFHNIANLMVLSSKIPEISKQIKTLVDQGKKVFVASDATGEAAVQELLDDVSLETDPKNASFADALARYTEKLKYVTITAKVGPRGRQQTLFRQRLDLNRTQEEYPGAMAEAERVLQQIADAKSMIESSRDVLGRLGISPMDTLRQQLESVQIPSVEISGRSATVMPDGTREKRTDLDQDRMASLSMFNNMDDMNVIAVSRSGSTGINAHNSPKFSSQKDRVFFLLQPSPNVVDTVQVAFRVNRTGQLTAPHLYMAYAEELPAEKRIMALTAKKMSRLGASSTGGQRLDMSETFGEDMHNAYGDLAMANVLARDETFRQEFQSRHNEYFPGSNEDEIRANLMKGAGNGDVFRRFEHMLIIMPLDIYSEISEQVRDEYNEIVETEKMAGRYNLTSEKMDYKAVLVDDMPGMAPYAPRKEGEPDIGTAQPTQLRRYRFTNPTPPPTSEQLVRDIDKVKADTAQLVQKYNESAEKYLRDRVNFITSRSRLDPRAKSALIQAITRKMAVAQAAVADAAEKVGGSYWYHINDTQVPVFVTGLRLNTKYPHVVASQRMLIQSAGFNHLMPVPLSANPLSRLASARASFNNNPLEQNELGVEMPLLDISSAGQDLEAAFYRSFKQTESYAAAKAWENHPFKLREKYMSFAMDRAGYRPGFFRVNRKFSDGKTINSLYYDGNTIIEMSPVRTREILSYVSEKTENAQTEKEVIDAFAEALAVTEDIDAMTAEGAVATEEGQKDFVKKMNNRRRNQAVAEAYDRERQKAMQQDHFVIVGNPLVGADMATRLFGQQLNHRVMRFTNQDGSETTGIVVPHQAEFSQLRKLSNVLNVQETIQRSDAEKVLDYLNSTITRHHNATEVVFTDGATLSYATTEATAIETPHSLKSIIPLSSLAEDQLADMSIMEESGVPDGVKTEIEKIVPNARVSAEGPYVVVEMGGFDAGNYIAKRMRSRDGIEGYAYSGPRSVQVHAQRIGDEITLEMWNYYRIATQQTMDSDGNVGPSPAVRMVLRMFPNMDASYVEDSAVSGVLKAIKALAVMRTQDPGKFAEMEGSHAPEGGIPKKIFSYMVEAAKNSVLTSYQKFGQYEVDPPEQQGMQMLEDEETVAEVLAGRATAVSDEKGPDIITPKAVEETEFTKALRSDMEAAFQTIDPRLAQVFVAHNRGMTFEAIADEFGLPPIVGEDGKERPNKQMAQRMYDDALRALQDFAGDNSLFATNSKPKKPVSKALRLAMEAGLIRPMSINAQRIYTTDAEGDAETANLVRQFANTQLGQAIMALRSGPQPAASLIRGIAEPPNENNKAIQPYYRLLSQALVRGIEANASSFLGRAANTDVVIDESIETSHFQANKMDPFTMGIIRLHPGQLGPRVILHEFVHAFTAQLIASEVVNEFRSRRGEMSGSKYREALTTYANKQPMNAENPTGAIPAMQSLVKAYLGALKYAKDDAGQPIENAIFGSGLTASYSITLPMHRATYSGGLYMSAHIDASNSKAIYDHFTGLGLQGKAGVPNDTLDAYVNKNGATNDFFVSSPAGSLAGLDVEADGKLILTPSGLEKLRTQNIAPSAYSTYTIRGTKPVFKQRILGVVGDPTKKAMSILYGFKNLDEFSAETMTNPAFLGMIASLDVPKGLTKTPHDHLIEWFDQLESDLLNLRGDMKGAVRNLAAGTLVGATAGSLMDIGAIPITDYQTLVGKRESASRSATPTTQAELFAQRIAGGRLEDKVTNTIQAMPRGGLVTTTKGAYSIRPRLNGEGWITRGIDNPRRAVTKTISAAVAGLPGIRGMVQVVKSYTRDDIAPSDQGGEKNPMALEYKRLTDIPTPTDEQRKRIAEIERFATKYKMPGVGVQQSLFDTEKYAGSPNRPTAFTPSVIETPPAKYIAPQMEFALNAQRLETAYDTPGRGPRVNEVPGSYAEAQQLVGRLEQGRGTASSRKAYRLNEFLSSAMLPERFENANPGLSAGELRLKYLKENPEALKNVLSINAQRIEPSGAKKILSEINQLRSLRDAGQPYNDKRLRQLEFVASQSNLAGYQPDGQLMPTETTLNPTAQPFALEQETRPSMVQDSLFAQRLDYDEAGNPVLTPKPLTPEELMSMRADLLGDLGKDIPEVMEMYRKLRIQPSGMKTMGGVYKAGEAGGEARSLANPGQTAEQRDLINAMDAMRFQRGLGVKQDAAVEEAASQMLSTPEGRLAVQEAVLSGQSLNTETTVAGMKLVADMAQSALVSGDAVDFGKAYAMAYMYREIRSEQGRALRAGYDRMMTPAQRNSEFLMSVMVSPERNRVMDLKYYPTEAQTRQDIRSLQATLEDLISQRNALTESQKGLAGDSEASARAMRDLSAVLEQRNAEIEAMQNQITDLQNRVTREQVMTQEAQTRLAEVNRILSGLGTNLEQLMKESELSEIRTGKPATQMLDQVRLSQKEREAVELIMIGHDPVSVSKQTKVKMADIKAAMDAMRAEAKRRFSQIAQTGMTRDQLRRALLENARNDTSMRQILAQRIPDNQPLSEEEAMEEIYNMLGLTLTPSGDYQWVSKDRKGKSNLFDIRKPEHAVVLARAIQAGRPTLDGTIFEAYVSSIFSGVATQLANVFATPAAPISISAHRGMQGIVVYALGKAGFHQEVEVDQVSPQQVPLFRPGIAYKTAPDLVKGIGREIGYIWKHAAPAWMRAATLARLAWATEAGFFDYSVTGAMEDIDNPQTRFGAFLQKYGRTRRTRIPGRLGRIVRMPLRALLAADEFSKMFRAYTAVGAHAYRLGKAAGLNGPELDSFIGKEIEGVGSTSWILAARRATRETFTQDLEPEDQRVKSAGDAGGRAMSLLAQLNTQLDSLATQLESDNLGTAALTLPARGILRLIQSFFVLIKSPFNIYREGLSYTPPAMANLAFRFASGTKTTEVDGRRTRYAPIKEYDDIIERTASLSIGSMIFTALLAGLSEGGDDDDKKWLLITGTPDPLSPGGQRTTRFGNSPFKILIRPRNLGYPDVPDYSVDYSRVEPLATGLSGGVNVARSLKEGVKSPDLAQSAAVNFLKDYFLAPATRTYGKQWRDLISLFPGQGVGWQRVLRDKLSAILVPNLFKQPLSGVPEYEKDVYNPEPLSMDAILFSVFPAFGDKFGIPDRRTFEGMKIPNPTPYEGAGPVERSLTRLLPGRGGVVYGKTAFEKFVDNYNQQHPDKAWNPDLSRPDRFFDDPYLRKRVSLTNDEYDMVLKLAAPKIKGYLYGNSSQSGALSKTDLEGFVSEDRKDQIQRKISGFYREAKQAVVAARHRREYKASQEKASR